ncbi:MAG TPA: class I SAM-dependent methyltransferase [Syntrophales bacterium]|nr:class I SAM-dependent methyltransferase [Syntrophales bacterium]
MPDPYKLSDILTEDVTLHPVEPGLYSIYPTGNSPGAYDSVGVSAIYDMVACNGLYNRLMWGYSRKKYTPYCETSLASSPDGWVLDLACGSLAFTADMYARYPNRPVVFLDQSLNLLRKGKARLEKLMANIPGNRFYLHADALQLPFRANVFKTVISLNLLHCIHDVKTVLREIKRVSTDDGNFAATTLIRSGRWSDRYLHLLTESGALVSRSPDELLPEFNDMGMSITHTVEGNLTFIRYE